MLLGIVAVTCLLILFTYVFPSQPLRIILGITVLLFCPGFVLSAAIAPRSGDMTGTVRLTLSLVLSIVVVSLTGLALNYTAPGITLESMLLSVAAFIVVVSIIGWLRLLLLPGGERGVLEFKVEMPHRAVSVLDGTFMIIMVLVLAVAIVAGGYFALAPKNSEPFTQFYILNQNQGTLYTPADLSAGGEATVALAIENHEGNQVDYRIQVLLNGEPYSEFDSISVLDEGQWQDDITFTPGSAGQNQVEFLLFKNSETEPYLRPLSLWVNVAGSAQ
jgi:uncharacterized membrane protein